MQLRRLTVMAVAIATTLLSTLSFGQATPPVGDTLTYSNNPNTNYGSYTALFAQKGSVTSASYIKFNLATLPAGVSVSKATLRLFVNQVAANGSFDVYQLNTSWTESTLTYNNAPALGTSASGNHPIAFTANSLNQFILIDITPLVQGWANGSIANDGLALALTTSAGAVAFDSKESIYTSHQPELEIALTGPAGPAGPQGPQGPEGLTGATGPAGATGPQGPIGLTGPAGTNGTNGTNGTSFTFKGTFNLGQRYSVNDVVADANGSSYIAITANNGSSDPAGDTTDWALMDQAGAAGPVGATGPQGPAGPIGLTGATGATGAQGPQGNTGSQGPQGNTGATGPQGPMGLQGPIGPTGATGAAGTGFNFAGAWSGSQSYNLNDVITYGDATYVNIGPSCTHSTPPNQCSSGWSLMAPGFRFLGPWPFTFPHGSHDAYTPNDVVTYQGSSYVNVGADCNPTTPDQCPGWTLMAQAGAAGATGATGATGAQGPQGDIGLTGAQGPAGTNGTNGTNGTSFTFQGTFNLGQSYNVNDVVADANGSSYIAITANNGSQDPAGDSTDWTLMAQAGAAGAAGPAGPAGSQGPTGPMGATGAQGPQGNTGPQGATGAQGPQGPAGPTTAAAVCSVLYPNLPAAYCASAPNTPKFVFVTATTFTGNLGGVAGGNAKCQTEAAAAGLPGTYNAWLSDNNGNYPAAPDQFNQSTRHYVTPNPALTVVASNWTQLISGSLQSPIAYLATGAAAPQGNVWTGTTSSGIAAEWDCSAWTSSGAPVGGAGEDSSTTLWTNASVQIGNPSCNNTYPIYCFQQ